MKDNFPSENDLKKEKELYLARRFAYKKYPKGGLIQCDICKKETKDIQRHHEDYNEKNDVCILVCRKCHGFIKRYNSLKKMLYTNERRSKIK